MSLLGLTIGSAQATPRIHMVAAGNNVGNAGEVPLRYAESDATTFATVMLKLGGVRSLDASLLLGAEGNQLEAAIRETSERSRARDERDSILVVYYSGHADAVGLSMNGTRVPYDRLKKALDASPAAVRVLIIDSCRSGTMTRVKGVKKPAKGFDLRLADRLAVRGTAIITSSAAGEASHESDRLRGGFFTHHLVTGLRGAADADGDARITLDEMYRYAYGQTLRSSRQAKLQHPTYQYDLRGRGQLVLTRLAADKGRSARLQIDRGGLYLVLRESSDGPVSAELEVPKGASVLLPAGDYIVQRRGRRNYREYAVSLKQGETVRLSKTPYRTEAFARLLRRGEGEASVVHGLRLSGGAHGETVDGIPVVPMLRLGYGVDFREISMSVGLRWSLSGPASGLGGTEISQQDLGLSIGFERFVDLRHLSLFFGAEVEGIWYRQTVDAAGSAPDRNSWGVGVTVLLGLERVLWNGLSLRLAVGPRTEIYERIVTDGGAPTGRELASPFTWFATLGLNWRL